MYYSLTVEAKLSSTSIICPSVFCDNDVRSLLGSPRRIMFAASLDTSEPDMFIAMPRSAFFNAGESLTPSPVLQIRVSIQARG